MGRKHGAGQGRTALAGPNAQPDRQRFQFRRRPGVRQQSAAGGAGLCAARRAALPPCRRIFVGPTFDLIDSRYADFANTYKVDNYNLLGLRSGYTTERWEVFAQVENMLDTEYVATLSVRDIAAPGRGNPQPGRATVILCRLPIPTVMATSANTRSANNAQQYRATWRWHFFAGVIVVPFLLVLAITGLVMVYYTSVQTPLGERLVVDAQGQESTSPMQQMAAASAALPGATVTQYIPASTPGSTAQFELTRAEDAYAVDVDPYSNEVLRVVDKDDTLYALAHRIHGSLLLGDVGDRGWKWWPASHCC
ncbi:MAG: TonB-dependent receptor [Haliea sp.]|nr:TonB-dependent receptor [Haliea sp.]